MKKFAIAAVMPLVAICAEAKGECSDVLQPTEIFFAANSSSHLDFLHTIDKTFYEELKKDASTAGNVVIEGVPIGGTADYSDFVKKREEYSEKVRIRNDNKNETVNKKLFVPKYQVDAFNLCRESNTKQFRVYASKIDEDYIEVTYSWNPQVPGQELEITGSSVTGGKSITSTVAEGKALPDNIRMVKAGWSASYLYERTPSIDDPKFRVDVTLKDAAVVSTTVEDPIMDCSWVGSVDENQWPGCLKRARDTTALLARNPSGINILLTNLCSEPLSLYMGLQRKVELGHNWEKMSVVLLQNDTFLFSSPRSNGNFRLSILPASCTNKTHAKIP